MNPTPPIGRLVPVLLALLALGSVPLASRAAEPEPSRPAKAAAEVRKVDVNQAEASELQVLPQVGPVVAQRIVDYRRAVGPFRKVEELLNVKGIGRKTLERLRPLITLGASEPAAPSSPAPASAGEGG